MKIVKTCLCAILIVALGCLLFWFLLDEGGAAADSSWHPDDRPFSAKPAVIAADLLRGPRDGDEAVRTRVGSETTLEVIVVQSEASVPAMGEVVHVTRHAKGSDLILAMTDMVADSAGRFQVTDIAGQYVVLQPLGGSECIVDGDHAPPTVTLRLNGKRGLAGTVVDGGGREVPDATIWLSFDGAAPVGAIVGKSNVSGAFAVSVPCGARRYIWAEAPGMQRSPMYLVASEPVSDEQSIVLELGGAAGSMTIRIRGPQGKPIPGAFVELGNPDIVIVYAAKWRGSRGLATWRRACADQEGCVVFQGVQCGPCQVTVMASGFGAWRQMIVVETRMSDLLINLEAGVSMRGIVTALGVACDGARVTWHPDGGGPKTEVLTNSDGLFVFQQLCAGWGAVEVRREQGGECWQANIRVLCRDGVVQDIGLSPMPSSKLLICDEFGNALRGWRISMLEDGATQTCVTDDRGLIDLGRECAVRRVAVYGPLQDGWEVLPRVSQPLGEVRKIVVPNALAAPGILSGVALDLHGSELLASRDQEAWPEKVRIETDQAGRFRLDGLPSGSCVVWRSKGGFCHRLQTFSIAPGTAQEVILVLPQ